MQGREKQKVNCDEISMSSKYEPLGHDLLVKANVFVCICSDSEGYLKTPASLLSELLCMILHVCARERKRDVFLHRHELKNLVAGETVSLLQPVFKHTMHIFIKGRFSFSFSFPKINVICICNAYS